MRFPRLRETSLVLAALLLGAPGVGLRAQEPVRDSRSAKEAPKSVEAIEAHPGFFDISTLDEFRRDDLEIHISVKGPLLKMVADAGQESELAEALGRLRGIEVRVYSLPEQQRGKARGALDRTAERLRKRGWQTAITVQVKRDHGYAFLRYENDSPVGLAAMYITDENQVVFVNIVGPMDMATIGRLARRYDLDLLAVPDPEKEP